MLADADAVSRSLIAGGQLEPVVDAWWVGEPTAQAERALGELDLGEVVTRARVTDDLARGPFEIIVPTVLTTLVVAAVVLLLAGIALVTGADQRRRAAELTRLRALGLPRRGAQRLLLAEHATFLVPLVLLGFCVGVAASWVLGTADGPLGPGRGPGAGRGGGLAVGHRRAGARRRGARVRARDLGGRGAPGARLGPGRAADGGLMMRVRVHRPTVRGRLRVDRGLLVLTGLVVALASALLAAVWPLTVRTADEAMADERPRGRPGCLGGGDRAAAALPRRPPPRPGRASTRFAGDIDTARNTIPDRLASVVRAQRRLAHLAVAAR